MSNDSTVIKVENLSKRYEIYPAPRDRLKQFVLPPLQHLLGTTPTQYFSEFWAMRDVSFEIKKGETVGIIGRNGSGKSTLLQMIAGTLTPTTGTVQVNGRVAALLELGSGFNLDFSGRENVFMNGAILGLSEAEIAARFDEIAAFADIGDFIEQPVKTYSSGMMVRLAFAVSVCVDPDILIVDEALSVGDMVFQLKCMERLKKLTQSGVTLLFVSHDIGAVKAFCKTAIYLKKGVMAGLQDASDIAEMYLMDMRDEQRSHVQGTGGVAPKASQGARVAFGTNQGKVTAAWFADTGSEESTYVTDDTIKICVQVEYDQTVQAPSVSILIQDRRLLEITGRFHLISQTERGTNTVSFTLAASFNTGSYHVTVRLEDRLSDQGIMPIDKQVGLLRFSVNRPIGRTFVGIVNLPIESAES